MNKNPITALLVFCLLFLTISNLHAEEFRYGIDALELSRCAALSGKRVGLITNASAVNLKGEPDYRVLQRCGVRLKFLMAPEHGFAVEGAAGQKISNTTLSNKLPVYSLYGNTKKPDRKVLKTIDVLVYDLQDIGTRSYTYISTMNYAMEACSAAGVTFMVLDRPNPIAPVPADGFMLDPAFESFVGAVRIPFIHAMTAGEIALWLQRTRYPRISLKVVRMRGYSRKKFSDEFNGFRFIPPSPNIRDVETALAYPAMVFLEATALSEGRGTEAPFRIFGAPFVDGLQMKTELDRYQLPGVQFQPTAFRPVSDKFAGQQCFGLRMKITDRYTFDPFRTSTAILLSLQKLYQGRLGLETNSSFFDKLSGTDLYRIMIQKQLPLEEILAATRAGVHEFERRNPQRFIYP
jgi:uncharacterized protein YbbC (DUF1343 family)